MTQAKIRAFIRPLTQIGIATLFFWGVIISAYAATGATCAVGTSSFVTPTDGAAIGGTNYDITFTRSG